MDKLVLPIDFDTQVLPPTSMVSSGFDNTLMPCVMPQPITTYHTSLSADKRPDLEPVNEQVHNVVVCSSEAQRSVDILQKFWGDCTNEELESSLVCPSAGSNKNQKKQANRQTSPKNTSVRTYKLVPKRV